MTDYENSQKFVHKKGFYEKYIKRALDFIFALLALIILSPVILCTLIIVKIKLGSPVIFKQPRPGLNENIFIMYKIRTMTNECDKDGNLLPDNMRMTKLGKFLRKTSIDELLELFCILSGKMSFIGPRPQLVRDMVFMTEEQRKRHTVRPGLSGLAQVSGRNNISWEEKLEYDLEYIENITFSGDLKILLATFKKAVIRHDDIDTDGMETAEDFGDYLLRLNKINQKDYMILQKKANDLLEVK